MAKSIYILNREIDEENDVLIVSTRLYSPFGLGTSIDFTLKWHQEDLLYSHFATAKMAIPCACDCRSSEPNVSAVEKRWVRKTYQSLLYNVAIENFRRVPCDIFFAPPRKLHLAAESLFGYQHLLSDPEIFFPLMDSTIELSIKTVFEYIPCEARASATVWNF